MLTRVPYLVTAAVCFWSIASLASRPDSPTHPPPSIRLANLLTGNIIVQHVRAELEYQRAARTVDPLARRAALRAADDHLTGLYGRSTTVHAWHTKCKIELLRLRTVLDDVNASEEEEVRSIQGAEDILSAALQRTPDDPLLLDSEARLAQMLKDAITRASSTPRIFS